MAALTPSEEELITLAQNGALDAFTQLYERYLPMVYNRVRFVIPELDVEDVTQEVFIAVMRSLRTFRGESRFTTWLRTLTNRQVADYYRRQNSPNKPISMEDSANTQISLDDHFVSDQWRQRSHEGSQPASNLDESITLRQALSQLSPNHREVILLRFMEGMQFNEIATEMGLSLDATKSLFRRAIASLNQHLGTEP